MVKLRISSLCAMTSNVFMRCIRELTYDMITNNPEYSQKIITDMIYYIKYSKNRFYFKKYFSAQPSPKLMEVVDAIVSMNSTLWWERSISCPVWRRADRSLCVFHYLPIIVSMTNQTPRFSSYWTGCRRIGKNSTTIPISSLKNGIHSSSPLPLLPLPIGIRRRTYCHPVDRQRPTARGYSRGGPKGERDG